MCLYLEQFKTLYQGLLWSDSLTFIFTCVLYYFPCISLDVIFGRIPQFFLLQYIHSIVSLYYLERLSSIGNEISLICKESLFKKNKTVSDWVIMTTWDSKSLSEQQDYFYLNHMNNYEFTKYQGVKISLKKEKCKLPKN